MTAEESRAERLYRIGNEMNSLTGQGESRNGFVSAVVGVRNELRSLRLDPRISRDPDPDALAGHILEAIAEARADVEERARALAGPLLPDDEDPFLRALDDVATTYGNR